MHPTIVRHLLLPIHERLLQRPTLSYLAELERSQWLSRQELEGLQDRRLGVLLNTALLHSPWHAARLRAAGIDLQSSRPFTRSDLRLVPTMDKADASRHRKQLVWKDAPGGACRYSTGGSSGEPLVFYFGRKRQAADAACRFRARRWWGHRIGDAEVLLWGGAIELGKTDAVRVIRDRCFNQLVLDAFHMSSQSMDQYLERIEKFQPRCIYGYASSLSLLAAHARSRSRFLRLPKLQVVFATGETLYPHQRQLIRETFAAPVANEYGCRDGGLIALESPDGQMLVNSETVILEVLDAEGREVAPGEVGEAVVTNLFSEAQPFIRYRTGDLVRQSDESCRSGRGLHVISEVMGRQTDFIVRSDGAIQHARSVIHSLRALDGIAQFKVIQQEIDRFQVLIRPNDAWTHDLAPVIIQGMRERVGCDADVEVSLRDEIPPEASGKHRYVVSHVELPVELAIAE
jgi:phenylacetate-CoA ligase